MFKIKHTSQLSDNLIEQIRNYSTSFLYIMYVLDGEAMEGSNDGSDTKQDPELIAILKKSLSQHLF